MDKKLLDILVCPVCKGDLVYEEGPQRLTCEACRLRYRVVHRPAEHRLRAARELDPHRGRTGLGFRCSQERRDRRAVLVYDERSERVLRYR